MSQYLLHQVAIQTLPHLSSHSNTTTYTAFFDPSNRPFRLSLKMHPFGSPARLIFTLLGKFRKVGMGQFFAGQFHAQHTVLLLSLLQAPEKLTTGQVAQ